MVVVAKARLLDFQVHGSLKKLARTIIAEAKRVHLPTANKDPLVRWFTEDAASIIRTIDHAIQQLLFDTETYCRLYASRLTDVSSLAAFFYVALFRATRDFLTPFFSSNPTWIKDAKEVADKIDLTWGAVEAAFCDHVADMDAVLIQTTPKSDVENQGVVRLEVASADHLPLADGSVDSIVTSPPYLTRIDYVVATRPELAILGCTPAEDDALRDRMTGTPTIAGSALTSSSAWGTTCLELLDRVEKHSSRASSTYYLPYYKQYFDAVSRSLGELDRVLKPRGRAVFVVQDSYFKELHVNLPKIFEEVGESRGWTVTNRLEYKVSNNLASIHPEGRKYRDSTRAVECAIVFSKPSEA
jgi:hypothetical protein